MNVEKKYSWNRYNQFALIQKQTAHLLVAGIHTSYKHNYKPKAVLDVGCGTGFVIESLQALYPHLPITGIDISKSVLYKCQELWPACTFIHENAEKLTHDTLQKYDWIVSNFSLHWFDDPIRWIQRSVENHPSALYALAYPVDGSLKKLTQRLKLVTGKSVPWRSFPTVTEIFHAIKNRPMHATIRDYTTQGYTLYDALRAIKYEGYPTSRYYTSADLRALRNTELVSVGFRVLFLYIGGTL